LNYQLKTIVTNCNFDHFTEMVMLHVLGYSCFSCVNWFYCACGDKMHANY